MDRTSLIDSKFIAMKLNTVYALKRQRCYDEAERALLELMEEYGDDPRIKKNMADVMLRQNRLQNALLLINEVLILDPKDGEAMIIKGNVYYKRRKYKEAMEWFQGAFRYKRSTFCLQMLIKCMIKTNKINDAMLLLESEIKKVNKEDTRFLRSKAEILEAKGEVDAAIEVYAKILEFTPQDKFIYKELIRLKTRKLDNVRASEEISTLLKVPSYSKNEHLYLQQAENYKKQLKYEEAIDVYKKGLEVSPGNLFIKKQIGFCCNRLKKYDMAVKYLKEAFMQEPTDFILRKTLFSVLKTLNRREEIINLIESMGITGTSLYYALLNEAKK